MSKVKFFLLALVALFFAATVSADVVWSSAFDFDGSEIDRTEQLLLLKTDNLNYSTAVVDGTLKVASIFALPTDLSTYVQIFDHQGSGSEDVEGTLQWGYDKQDIPHYTTYTLTLSVENGNYTEYESYDRLVYILPEPAMFIVLAFISLVFIRRHIKKLLAALVIVSLMSFSANATTSVSDVSFLQIWPFDRYVVIRYTVTTDCSDDLSIKFYGTTDNGETSFDLSEKGTLTKDGATGTITGSGTYKTIWTPDSTLYSTKGKMKIGVEVTEPPAPPTYMIVDLSANTVSYTNEEPSGTWNVDEYKTTKMVFRLVPAGEFDMGSPTGEIQRRDNEEKHKVTLTKDFYIGIFEVTQEQYSYITTGESGHYSGSYSDNNLAAAGGISYDMLRGNNAGAGWPNTDGIDDNCILDKLRRKANNLKFELPTEAQWEYACRAGTTTALNNGENLINPYNAADPYMDQVGSYSWNNSVSPETVGNYVANNWGLYDMHGNVSEWCLDWYGGSLGSAAVTDPKGAVTPTPNPYTDAVYRMARGGNCFDEANECRSARRVNQYSPDYPGAYLGFRPVLTLD